MSFPIALLKSSSFTVMCFVGFIECFLMYVLLVIWYYYNYSILNTKAEYSPCDMINKHTYTHNSSLGQERHHSHTHTQQRAQWRPFNTEGSLTALLLPSRTPDVPQRHSYKSSGDDRRDRRTTQYMAHGPKCHGKEMFPESLEPQWEC